MAQETITAEQKYGNIVYWNAKKVTSMKFFIMIGLLIKTYNVGMCQTLKIWKACSYAFNEQISRWDISYYVIPICIYLAIR